MIVVGNKNVKIYYQLAFEMEIDCGKYKKPSNLIVKDNESKKLAEEEKQKRIELEKKLAELEKKSQSKVIVEDEASKRLAEEEKQKRLKEEQKRKELEQKLAILSKKNKVNVDMLVEDNTAPVISAQSKQDGFYANISGTITDDVKLAEVLMIN